MRRLGYRRYGAAGNDWGSFISPELGRIAPEAVVGVHVTQAWCAPPDAVLTERAGNPLMMAADAFLLGFIFLGVRHSDPRFALVASLDAY